MTSDQLIEKALRRIVPTPPMEMRASLRTALAVMVPSVLIEVAIANSRSPQAELLRTTFATVTAVDGVAPLNALISAAEPLLLESKLEVFLTGLAYPLEPVPDRATLQIEASIEFGFYCIEGVNIHVKNANEDYGAYDGAVTITGSRIPTLSTVPTELEDQLVKTLAANAVPAQGAD